MRKLPRSKLKTLPSNEPAYRMCANHVSSRIILILLILPTSHSNSRKAPMALIGRSFLGARAPRPQMSAKRELLQSMF